MRYKDFKEQLLFEDLEFKKEYEKTDLAFEIGKMILEARILKDLTQKDLARILHTKQPGVARIENGTSLPGLKFLQRIAKALGTYLIPPKFGFMEEMKENFSSVSKHTGVNYVFFPQNTGITHFVPFYTHYSGANLEVSNKEFAK